ncbi:hypothetical protein [Thalassotalea profundi]|uniref:PepSY domain-containing protein n=1 Tax=Thalassotalea profundi TaxID=2036687 RepID=A0ABQ3J7U5_9GAMM|nr:hypothetical protein [Thalassotalea profundi]GHF01939.1 hypothetical protein GCM10011501_34180 [Thalassotalea profundi]
MKYIFLIALFFYNSLCYASSSAIFDKLNNENKPSPQTILKKIETEYLNTAVIVEFELEFEKGQTNYEVTLFEQKYNRFIELLIDVQGKLVELEYAPPELDEDDEVAAAKLMRKKNYRMYQLVQSIDSSQTQYLIEAQLEQDMGVTYMVATFVSIKGRHKKAIDLATGKNLPLLRWGN